MALILDFGKIIGYPTTRDYYVTNLLSDEVCEETIDKYINPSGSWNRHKFKDFLPLIVVKEILRMRISPDEDGIRWRWNNSGKLTIKSTYIGLSPTSNTTRRGFWRKLWKAPIPQRNKTFLCLCSHGRIMMNVFCAVRRLQTDTSWALCLHHREDIMHVLYDCYLVEGRWERVVPLEWRSKFLSFETHEEWMD